MYSPLRVRINGCILYNASVNPRWYAMLRLKIKARIATKDYSSKI